MSDYGTDGVGQNSGTRKNYSTSQPHQTDDTSLHLRKVSEIYESLRQDIVQRTDEIKYPFGLTELDEKTLGVHKKELLCIGARTSAGKSAFAVNMTKHLVDKGVKVAYFSLEMSSEQLVERLVTNLCEINNIELRAGRGLRDLESRESVFKSWADNIHLLIDDKYGYHFDNVVRIAEELRPDFVILDYIQMISTKGFRGGKLEAIEEYIRKIKQLANEYDMGAVVLSQLNRSAEGDARMSKLKWAGVLEEHSDTVILLEWNWEKDEYLIRIEKQRHGMVGNLRVDFKPQYSKFADSDRPFYELPRKDLE
jgi:replicative DNA helicase